ncbi:MAG TPA: DUF3379 family protein [Rudaea sp.]|nr:DUF3379 family protein [Rudaea sp.]
MNCLEFRRELNIHPQSNDADFVAHARECPRCAQAQADALAFEATLGRALAIPPPPNLAESILLAQATEQRRERLRWRRGTGLLAVAAAAVLAVGVGWRVTRAQPLGDAAVAHMLGEEAPALAMTTPVTEEAVRKAFAKRGIDLTQVPADISYVQCCPVGKFKSVHMVMPRTNGPVTVMYLVDDNGGARTDFAHAGWIGRSVPMAHGTLVMIGHDASQFAQIEQEWQSTLQAASRI